MQPYNPRSDASQTAYDAFKARKNSNIFNFDEETIVREFTHWLIIENRFPYDNIARINHLLISREPIDLTETLGDAMQAELSEIKNTLATEATYDAYIENFPKAATMKTHMHIHLIAWHNTST